MSFLYNFFRQVINRFVEKALMENKSKRISPDGYSVVCPYLMVDSVETELDFLRKVFNAEVKELLKLEDGTVQHGEATIGDTVIMMGKARTEWPATFGANYVFVENADQVYDKAIKNGSSSLLVPADRFYGYREAGVKDPQGNTWWIAQVLEVLTEDEMQNRLSEKTKSSR
jgi:PhnB protein